MRRLLTFAAFLLIIAIVPVCAQRGGRGSGGGQAGAGGSHGGFGGSRAGFGGHPGLARYASGGPTHVSSGFHHYGAGPRSFRGERVHDRGFRHHCFGCYGYGSGYGYPFYSYYDPYWGYDSYSSYDSYSAYDADAERERALANEMNAENVDEQRLRQQDQDLYARPGYGSTALQSRQEEHAKADPPTILVFRDQHQREVQNYAIVGPMLWNFTLQRTEKIPLADLDVPATTKANDDRGVDFKLPRASEGQ